jgi:hypothetical protein
MDRFKAEVGRLILIGAIGYCAALTFGLLAGAVFKVELSQPMRDILIIILTWFTTKAGTVVDHQYGSSAGSELKTQLLTEGRTMLPRSLTGGNEDADAKDPGNTGKVDPSRITVVPNPFIDNGPAGGVCSEVDNSDKQQPNDPNQPVG